VSINVANEDEDGAMELEEGVMELDNAAMELDNAAMELEDGAMELDTVVDNKLLEDCAAKLDEFSSVDDTREEEVASYIPTLDKFTLDIAPQVSAGKASGSVRLKSEQERRYMAQKAMLVESAKVLKWNVVSSNPLSQMGLLAATFLFPLEIQLKTLIVFTFHLFIIFPPARTIIPHQSRTN